jgi:hypothetical protein
LTGQTVAGLLAARKLALSTNKGEASMDKVDRIHIVAAILATKAGTVSQALVAYRRAFKVLSDIDSNKVKVDLEKLDLDTIPINGTGGEAKQEKKRDIHYNKPPNIA